MRFVPWFLLIFAGHAFAQVGDECNPKQNVLERYGARDMYQAACKKAVQEANCDEYFKDKFVLKSERNTCENTFAERQILFPIELLKECPVGTFDGIWNGPDIITDPLETAWDILTSSVKLEQPTPNAKRHERAEKYRQAIREQVDWLSLPTEEKVRLHEEAQAERDRAYAASRVIEEILHEINVKMVCYSRKKQIEVACYGLGVAVNNLTYATLIKAGVKVVAKVATKGVGVFSRGRAVEKLYKAAGIEKSAPKPPPLPEAGP